MDLVDAGLAGDGPRRVGVVAGQHHDVDAERPAARRRPDAARARMVSATAITPSTRVVAHQHDARSCLPPRSRRARPPAPGCSAGAPRRGGGCRGGTGRRRRSPPTPAPGDRLEVGDRRAAGPARRATTAWATGCSDAASIDAREPADLVGVTAPATTCTSVTHRPAVRERAGLVEGDDRARGGPARGAAPPLIEDAAPRRPAEAADDRHRRRDDQRARAGEHEQHEGPVEPLVEAAQAEQHGHGRRGDGGDEDDRACTRRRSGRRSAASAPARPAPPGSTGRCGRACRRRAPPSPARRSRRAG